MAEYERYCQLCGNFFTTNSSRRIYCSPACGDDAHRLQKRDRMRAVYAERAMAKYRYAEPFKVDKKIADIIENNKGLLISSPRMDAKDLKHY